ncbi:tripartite motif-containing protein 16 [Pangasianodon hypophthalmus]|uniref:tripartite motif-containing protein 16 n=1 Tax=Pangasianodon hypophthalmus TaxID=310915 RepID=UPI001480584D|nr:tripartite motif-containing protein 16 [Pangasianodon hypophthalmus]
MSRRSSVADQSHYSSLGKSQRSETYGKYSNPRPNSRNSQRNVLCDFCLVKKMKAVKSCLTCLTSFCETHLQAHYEYPALMKHKLVTATGQLKEKICAEHDKLLEVFCRSDQMCVCVLCIMDEHKKHDIVSAAAERTEKQKQLSAKLMSSQQKIDERVKKWQDLMQATESLKHSSQSVLEENERIFTELMQALERRYTDVKELIRAQETALMTQAERHLSRMEEEITLLRMKHNDLERLSQSEDHIHFLQSWQALSAPSGYEDLSKVTLAPLHSFDKVKKAISELKIQVEDASKGELNKISSAVREVQILQILEPKTREDFLKHYSQLSLDPLTAHPNLHLSKGNTVVQMSSEHQSYPEHPERYDYWQQVLCKEGMTGSRYYWEIEWSGTEVDIAVTYKEASRKGSDNACSFGWSDKSWSLYCSESKCTFMHRSKRISVPLPISSKIGVYLDHKAATLAFYSISDTMTLLHRVHTSFTEPVYAGFGVWGYGSTVKIL